MDYEKIIQIRSNDLAPERGRILLSEPFMGDFYFGRAVVLLAEHNDEGSFGLIMNKPVQTAFNEIVQDFPPFDARVYLGGPVGADRLFFIHTLGNEIPDSSEILHGLYWGGNMEIVREMVLLGLVQPEQIRFYLGYSGWEAKQLDAELERNSWLVSKATVRGLLQTQPDKMWNYYVRRMGTEYDMWRRFPVDPQMN
ncbi:MAG: YqgE/AlgH family protein [Bacteroidales bacterium]|nr:YqgE/AlgH family protein [Bacteroidales bacterium]